MFTLSLTLIHLQTKMSQVVEDERIVLTLSKDQTSQLSRFPHPLRDPQGKARCTRRLPRTHERRPRMVIFRYRDRHVEPGYLLSV